MGFWSRTFTWWNGATWGTKLFTWRFGDKVGSDDAGNVYYRSKKGRRWVIYAGDNDGSNVPPGWNLWLKGSIDELPDKALQPAAGVWRIRAEVEGESFEGEFKLKEFTKPEYQVNVQLERPSYVEGDEVSGRVLARFFHGGVLKNADVQLTVYRSRFFIPDFVDAEADFFVSEGERASAGRFALQEALMPYEQLLPPRFRGRNERIDERF